MSFKIRENIYCLIVKQIGSEWEANLLDISSGSKLFVYDTIVVSGRLTLSAPNLTLCMLGNFFKYFFLTKDAKNHC